MYLIIVALSGKFSQVCFTPVQNTTAIQNFHFALLNILVNNMCACSHDIDTRARAAKKQTPSHTSTDQSFKIQTNNHNVSKNQTNFIYCRI